MPFETEVIESLNRIEENFGARLKWVEYKLNGNGSPGLLLDVHDLKEADKGRKERAFWIKSLLMSNVAIILGLLGKLAKLF